MLDFVSFGCEFGGSRFMHKTWIPRQKNTIRGYPILGKGIQLKHITMRTKLAVFWLTVLAWATVSLGHAQSQSGFTPGSLPATATASAPVSPHSGYDPLLDLPPLPRGEVTLVGGTVDSTDEVMNRMVIQPFGGKQKMRIHFDTRTHFYLDGKPITEREVPHGARVYVDTMLNGDRVFAKAIWLRSSAESGISRGQIIELDVQHNTLTVRDELSDQPIKLRISSATTVRRGEQAASLTDLREGALVALGFSPQNDVNEINLLATPGSAFTFAGRVTYLDLSRKLIAIDNRSDGKKYDVYLEAIAPNVMRQLREGVNVTVSAVFDGTRYAARTIGLQSASSVAAPH